MQGIADNFTLAAFSTVFQGNKTKLEKFKAMHCVKYGPSYKADHMPSFSSRTICNRKFLVDFFFSSTMCPC